MSETYVRVGQTRGRQTLRAKVHSPRDDRIVTPVHNTRKLLKYRRLSSSVRRISEPEITSGTLVDSLSRVYRRDADFHKLKLPQRKKHGTNIARPACAKLRGRAAAKLGQGDMTTGVPTLTRS
jgi:hypothetical protein